MAINYIVFYGTLRRATATSLHPVMMRGLTFIGGCLLPGKLYDMGRYPALKKGEGTIHGELYRIKDEKILSLLDEYEASDSLDAELPGFTRRPVKLITPKLEAWAYYYDGKPSDKLLIGSGNWEAWKARADSGSM